jgi:DNA-binding response OmpR family regulator
VPETILVVDDDPDIARFVEVNLRSAGYDVAVAADCAPTWSCWT